MVQRWRQFTLDLFGPDESEPEVTQAAPASDAPPSKPIKPIKPIKPASPRPSAPAKPAAERDTGPSHAETPAEPLDRQLAPAQFRHPQANREIRLPGAVVGYQFKRGKRRTIGFVVGADGLVVRAPKWVPLGEVD